MKLNEVVMTRPLIEKIAAMEIDASEAKEFAVFAREVLKAIQDFEVKRAELFQKYGIQEGEGPDARLVVPQQEEKKFNAAIKRALNKDLDVEPFDLASLGIKLTPAELVNALALFK